MNDDVITSAEGEAPVLPDASSVQEGRERSVVLLLEALEGRLATPEYRELLRILAPTKVDTGAQRAGNG